MEGRKGIGRRKRVTSKKEQEEEKVKSGKR